MHRSAQNEFSGQDTVALAQFSDSKKGYYQVHNIEDTWSWGELGWNTAIFGRFNNTSIYETVLSNLRTLLDLGIYSRILCDSNILGGVLSTILASNLAANDVEDQQIQVLTCSRKGIVSSLCERPRELGRR